MKKYLVWILAVLCALLPKAALAAENCNTQLTTTLPEEHTISVVCSAGGAVRVEGTIYEYYGAAEPPVRCGESHLSGLTEPPIDSYSA